jgi:hypothetical protein
VPSSALPEWIELTPGRAPLLLFAPHGGRRVAPRHPGRHRVNDLYTAALTRELAAAWTATGLVNGGCDRNEIDLNRLEQVRRAAPWLLDVLGDTVGAMVREHGRATVLVIHGWNVVQPVCDVGIGAVDRAGQCVAAAAGSRTASAAFVTRVLRPLQRRAAAAGIAVTVGARYPAAHPNNLLQLFGARHRDDPVPAIRELARLAASGVVDAVQLELGIPLRWPGRERESFTAVLTRTFVAGRGDGEPAPGAPGGTPNEGSAPALGAAVPRRLALEFADHAWLGLASVATRGPGAAAGRLLVSPAPASLALFTGELVRRRSDRALVVPPLECIDTGGGVVVRYRGSLLAFPALTPFLDLERGLARGRLVAADLELAFSAGGREAARAGRGRFFGIVTGSIALEGVRRRLRAGAMLARDVAPWAPAAMPSLRLTLPETPLGPVELRAAGGTGALAATPCDTRVTFAVSSRTDDAHARPPVRGTAVVNVEGESGSLHLALSDGSGDRWRAGGELQRLVPVRRPGRPAGAVVHVTYALCRFPGLAAGWLELAVEGRPVPPAGPVRIRGGL